MRYIKKIVNHKEIVFLEVNIYDNDDIKTLSLYCDEQSVMIGMNDLEYLENFNNIHNLYITSGEIKKSSWQTVYNLEHLKALFLDYEETDSYSEYSIDCSKIKTVEYLFSKSSLNFFNIDKNISIKTLIVTNWYNKDLQILGDCFIDTLCIFNGKKIASLEGIQRLQHLCVLSLSYLKILSIGNISKLSNLVFLEIDMCNRISDIDVISQLPQLEYIIITSNIVVDNLSFLKEMKSLKRAILDIKVIDGDISLLKSLERAIVITERKNFNAKNADLPKTKEKYVIDFIPSWRNFINGRNL